MFMRRLHTTSIVKIAPQDSIGTTLRISFCLMKTPEAALSFIFHNVEGYQARTRRKNKWSGLRLARTCSDVFLVLHGRNNDFVRMILW